MSIKTITLNEFKKRDYNANKISRYKLVDCICIKCNTSFEYSSVRRFTRNRKNRTDKKYLWDTCARCWFIINTVESSEWIQKNKDAQLIAQNNPEVKRKNAESVSKSWTKERKDKLSKYLKDRWKNDVSYREKILNNISWTQKNDDRFVRLMKKSIGIGGLKGTYKDMYYDSALELSYILYCESNLIKIKRYDLDGIKYFDENNKSRVYVPDFIINDNIIIEIKGLGLYYKKNYLRNLKKTEALKEWATLNNYEYKIIFSNDAILNKNYKTARKLHYEIKKQKDSSL